MRTIDEAISNLKKLQIYKAYLQVAWERDIAISQLAEIGKSFGESMDDVKEAVNLYEMIKRRREEVAREYECMWQQDKKE